MTERTPPSPDRDGYLEARLRTALAHQAETVAPGERLGEIRNLVARGADRPRGAWLWPVAVAAAVAAFVFVAWLGLRPPTTTPTPAATTSSAPATSAPATSAPAASAPAASAPATGAPSASAPSTGAPSTSAPSTSVTPGPALVAVALPVYYVAPPAQAGGHYGLVRVFVPAQLADGASTEVRADAALALAVSVPADNPNRFVAAWPDGTTARWVTMPQPEIGVQLSGPGVTGLPEEGQRLAVQALVWTVTGVAQRADAPVAVTLAAGGRLFETLPGNVYKRPRADGAYQEIAPVWVDQPYAGQRFGSGVPVTVTGQACAFEATVAWELRSGGAVVRKGSTTASSACPQQGSWSVDLGRLAPGAYEFRGIEYSAKDGSIAAQTITPFTVG